MPGRILKIFKGEGWSVAYQTQSIRNLDGKFCVTPGDSLRRWKQHFSTVLNTSSVFSEDTFSLPMLYVMGWLVFPSSKKLEIRCH